MQREKGMAGERRKVRDLSIADLATVVSVLEMSEKVGSFESACERLQLSKTTLSSQISRVEDVFGQLFLKGNGGRRLPIATHRGLVFLESMRKILKRVDKLVEFMNEIDYSEDFKEIEDARNTLKTVRDEERRSLIWERINKTLKSLPSELQDSLDRQSLLDFARTIPRRDPLDKHTFHPKLDENWEKDAENRKKFRSAWKKSEERYE